MESTVAFSTLMELIQVVGSFVTAPIFFNLSVIHILVISFLFNMIIGLLLGGIVIRAHPRSAPVSNTIIYKDPYEGMTPFERSHGGMSYEMYMENRGLSWKTGKPDPALKHK